jgi:hypothetical protein
MAAPAEHANARSLNGPTASPTRAEIPEALENLHVELKILQESVSILASTLMPVSRQEPIAEDPCIENPYSSEVARSIFNATDGARRIREHINCTNRLLAL